MGVRLWLHGLVLTIVLLVVTTVFALFGLTLSFAILGSLDSLGALIFVCVTFILLPLIYGWVGTKISEVLHEDVSSKEVDSLGDWVLVWIHGLVSVVILLFIATFFGFFGLTLTTTVLMNALKDVGAFVFAFLSFTVLPIVYGYVGKSLSQLF